MSLHLLLGALVALLLCGLLLYVCLTAKSLRTLVDDATLAFLTRHPELHVQDGTPQDTKILHYHLGGECLTFIIEEDGRTKVSLLLQPGAPPALVDWTNIWNGPEGGLDHTLNRYMLEMQARHGEGAKWDGLHV